MIKLKLIIVLNVPKDPFSLLDIINVWKFNRKLKIVKNIMVSLLVNIVK